MSPGIERKASNILAGAQVPRRPVPGAAFRPRFPPSNPATRPARARPLGRAPATNAGGGMKLRLDLADEGM
ncbi:hypothetical protein OJF2_41610 [Aquisphaera giovannonii]|uniref:Uncharacterized protein n=1 Tax=Aquisphaera giovannonii TaxID=406548 RepID=A0A5B9W4Y9_9BACT|nr:hypothetical protein OJF2_41610 [Aquisphaera giovannonii]